MNTTRHAIRGAVAAAAVLACWLAATAPRAAAGDRTVAGAAPATLYHNYCSVCHGERGDGQSRARNSLNPPPADFTTAAALRDLSRARMLLAVREGRPGTAMVGWKTQLSDEQIAAVVDYVRETFMRASTEPDAGRGRQIYAKTCAVCHGDRGAGSGWASAGLKPPPRDFSAPAAKGELTRERMIAAVTHGRAGTAMAGFATQLQPADVEAVVDYIRAAFMLIGSDAGISGTHARGSPAPVAPAHGQGAAVADMSLPLPYRLVGDAARGRVFYDANCATCHGKLGDANGPRAYFINPRPRSFIAPESRLYLNRPALFAATSAGKTGTEMPAWDKVLGPQQIANVAEYVFVAFIRQDGGRAGSGRAILSSPP